MSVRLMNICIYLIATLTAIVNVHAQNCDPEGHLDIAAVVQDNKITTGVYNLDDPDNALLVDVGTRVWGGQFQVNTADPFFTDDPGFGAITNSGLPAGSLVGFNIMDDLQYWDGTGFVQFGPVPNGERLRIKLGSQNRCVGTGTGYQSGFNMAVVSSTGTIHVHTSMFLLGPDGPSNICTVSPPVNSQTPPTDGIYLLKLQLKSSNSSIIASDPIFVVFANFSAGTSTDGCAHCVALNYVGAYLAYDRAPADLDFDRYVDESDWAIFRSCLGGANVLWNDPCCQGADIDLDGDVDLSDFGLFQRCINGPNQVASPNCAEP